MQAVIFSLVAFLSTYIGGSLAIKLKNRLHQVMAFSAGILLGVVFFDIFPEIIELIRENGFQSIEAMIALVFGFLLFHILEKTILIHHAHEDDYKSHKHPDVGVVSALALAGHSFMDGVGIGFGFQISNAMGIFVALAVIAHDFTDGINTITLMLTHKNEIKKAKKFLLLDALAPILGAASTLFFVVSAHFLLLYLGFFAGFLLYIGASDILPEAHSQKSSMDLIALTILGTLTIFIITRFI